MHKMLI